MLLKIKYALGTTGIVLAALYSVDSSANVSFKNGNFYMGYTDVVYSGGFEPKVDRVYNSKTPYKGVFGWGWGFEYEAYLTVAADGSVIMHEYGGGAENRFNPIHVSQVETDKAATKIAEVAQSVGGFGSKSQMEAYKQRLKRDATFRNDEWEKFQAQGKLSQRQLPNGTQLQSVRFNYQYITRVPGGYVRNFDNGTVQKFNDSGKLVRISDKNNNYIEFSYGRDGHIQKLVDNFNRKMFFTFDNRGLISKVEAEVGKTASYSYNTLGEMIGSRDADGNTYTYKYDSAGRHNLIQIGYSDKTTLDIAYHPKEKLENVKSVKERDGSITEYQYDGDPANHYTVSIHSKDPQGKTLSNDKYQFFMKRKATGEEWTEKVIAELDGQKTETTYNECCGLPVVIKQNGQQTSFEYDIRGRVLKKTTPTEMTVLSYDKVVGKIVKVTNYSPDHNKVLNSSEFKYDNKGNLRFAKGSDGKTVSLFYDETGRIIAMVDQNKHRINFKYNEHSKPIEISDPKLGTISVTYTNSGDIKEVKSSAGRKIASEVSASFQGLLDIIRPAGVTLSF